MGTPKKRQLYIIFELSSAGLTTYSVREQDLSNRNAETAGVFRALATEAGVYVDRRDVTRASAFVLNGNPTALDMGKATQVSVLIATFEDAGRYREFVDKMTVAMPDAISSFVFIEPPAA
jgi:hypothetical protein